MKQTTGLASYLAKDREIQAGRYVSSVVFPERIEPAVDLNVVKKLQGREP